MHDGADQLFGRVTRQLLDLGRSRALHSRGWIHGVIRNRQLPWRAGLWAKLVGTIRSHEQPVALPWKISTLSFATVHAKREHASGPAHRATRIAAISGTKCASRVARNPRNARDLVVYSHIVTNLLGNVRHIDDHIVHVVIHVAAVKTGICDEYLHQSAPRGAPRRLKARQSVRSWLCSAHGSRDLSPHALPSLGQVVRGIRHLKTSPASLSLLVKLPSQLNIAPCTVSQKQCATMPGAF